MKVFLGILILSLLSVLSFALPAKTKAKLPPVAVTASEIPVGVVQQMSIDAYDTVYYTFKTVDAGNYRISTTNADTDLGWIVETADDIEVLECDEYDDETDEVCTLALEAGTEYTLIVDEYTDEPTDYELLIEKN